MSTSCNLYNNKPEELADPCHKYHWKCFLKFTRGKTKYGGMLFPISDTAAATVTNVPRSPEVIAPTVLTSVSSIGILDITYAWNLCLSIVSFDLAKNNPTM